MATVRFKGPLFDHPGEAMRKGANVGLKELGARIEATVRLNTPSDTGSYKRTIKTQIWNGNRGLSVKSTDTKQRKTWLERGTRGGKKLTTANRMWGKGKSKAREINKQSLLAPGIARELRG